MSHTCFFSLFGGGSGLSQVHHGGIFKVPSFEAIVLKQEVVWDIRAP